MVPFGADSASGTAPGDSLHSAQALLQHLQSLSQVPAMQNKLRVLSESLPGAPQDQPGSQIDGSNWEGDADSKAWQYDCEVHAAHACRVMHEILWLCWPQPLARLTACACHADWRSMGGQVTGWKDALAESTS